MTNIRFDDYKEKIANALKDKGVKCNCNAIAYNFSIIDSFVNQPIQKELSGSIVIGGPTLPLVATVCTNCGKVHYFALKALLPEIQL